LGLGGKRADECREIEIVVCLQVVATRGPKALLGGVDVLGPAAGPVLLRLGLLPRVDDGLHVARRVERARELGTRVGAVALDQSRGRVRLDASDFRFRALGDGARGHVDGRENGRGALLGRGGCLGLVDGRGRVLGRLGVVGRHGGRGLGLGGLGGLRGGRRVDVDDGRGRLASALRVEVLDDFGKLGAQGSRVDGLPSVAAGALDGRAVRFGVLMGSGS
jgi:hypothetical protein